MKRPARKAARNPKSLRVRKKRSTTLALPRTTIGGRIRSGVHSNMFLAPRRVALRASDDLDERRVIERAFDDGKRTREETERFPIAVDGMARPAPRLAFVQQIESRPGVVELVPSEEGVVGEVDTPGHEGKE